MLDNQKRNKLLKKLFISSPNETYDQMIERVCDAICQVESIWNNSSNYLNALRKDLSFILSKNLAILGTPILMQIGKRNMKSISSCASLPIDITRSLAIIKKTIEFYYENNMGTGFNLSDLDNPIDVILTLNDHARQITKTHENIRHIGNIAILDCTHPKIFDFIEFKATKKSIRHFNLSVNLSNEFCSSHREGKNFKLRNGQQISTTEFINILSRNIYKSAEPGIVFLDRINKFNPTPNVGLYRTTAPCSEMGLLNGETCVFAYLNLAKLWAKNRIINYKLLQYSTKILTRVLDDCVEIQIQKNNTDSNILLKKRKIAIGVCGFADLLVKLNVPYGSTESIEILKNILLTITYYSKIESIQLAQERGSFLSFRDSLFQKESFLHNQYGKVNSTILNQSNWIKLDKLIQKKKHLRNSHTTAIPPSGQSSLLLGVSPSIEPWFSFSDKELIVGEIFPEIPIKDVEVALLEKDFNIFPRNFRKALVCATDIDHEKQIDLVSSATKCIDGSISKTINLKENCSLESIQKIIERAINSNINGISVFRNKSICNQPYKL